MGIYNNRMHNLSCQFSSQPQVKQQSRLSFSSTDDNLDILTIIKSELSVKTNRESCQSLDA